MKFIISFITVANIAHPPGSPKPVETPRTKRLREVRLKRLAYFESQKANRDEEKSDDLKKQEESKENPSGLNQECSEITVGESSNGLSSDDNILLKSECINGNLDMDDCKTGDDNICDSVMKDVRVPVIPVDHVKDNIGIFDSQVNGKSRLDGLHGENDLFRPESQESVLRGDLESEKYDLFDKIQCAKAALSNIGKMDQHQSPSPLPNLSTNTCIEYSPRTFDNLNRSDVCSEGLLVNFDVMNTAKPTDIEDDRLSIISDKTVESPKISEPLSVKNDGNNLGPLINLDENAEHVSFDSAKAVQNNFHQSDEYNGMHLEEFSTRKDVSDSEKAMLADDLQREKILTIAKELPTDLPMIHIPNNEVETDFNSTPENVSSRTNENFKETFESLEDVLGKNRLSRLMKNLIETDQMLGEETDTKLLSGIAGASVDESVLRSIWFDNIDDDETAVLQKQDIDSDSDEKYDVEASDLKIQGLEKHRPVAPPQPMHNETIKNIRLNNNIRRLSSASKDRVRCAFSVDEIYHQAERFSSGSVSSPPVTPELARKVSLLESDSYNKGTDITNNNDNLHIDLNFTSEDGQVPVEDPNLKSTLDRYFASMESAGMTAGRDMNEYNSSGKEDSTEESPDKRKMKKTKTFPVKRVTQVF